MAATAAQQTEIPSVMKVTPDAKTTQPIMAAVINLS
jgi:hypothetical protein